MGTSISVAISEPCQPYVAQALVRLSYLHPDVRFECTDHIILVEFNGEPTFPTQEITYQVYREKIYQESLPMRELMYRTLLT